MEQKFLWIINCVIRLVSIFRVVLLKIFHQYSFISILMTTNMSELLSIHDSWASGSSVLSFSLCI